MRIELKEMIHRFRSAQDCAVAILTDQLGFAMPDSGLAWVFFCCEQRLHAVDGIRGIPFRAHRYGVELEIDGVRIDFDWGSHGQPDGFDGWRLWWHYSSNGWPAPGTHSEVSQWLEDAHRAGELEKQDALYFDPTRRSLLCRGEEKPD